MLLGLEQELIDARWTWICTLCGRCQWMCPQDVQLLSLLRNARTHRPHNEVPGVMQKGVAMCLEKGNNLGIPEFDYLFFLADLSKEMDKGTVELEEDAEEYPHERDGIDLEEEE